MEQKFLISIIVPIYNTARYLSQCLDSMIQQTYANIEIILINDGSTDNSGDICNQYSMKDSRIQVIHSENKGVSSARNLGLRVAKGDYIAFVDSDDWLELDAFNKIYKKISNAHYDLLIYGIVKESIGNKKKLYSELAPCSINSADKIKSVIPYLIEKEIINSPIKVYNHALIKSYKIRFRDGLDIAEDYLFNMECFLKANSLMVIDEVLYHYMIREKVSLTRKFQEDKYHKLMSVNEEILELVKDNGNCTSIIEAVQCIRIKNIYSCFIDIFNKECKYNYQEKLSFLDNILKSERKNINDIKIIKNRKYKTLSLLMKIKSSRIIYIITKLLYKMKQQKLA